MRKIRLFALIAPIVVGAALLAAPTFALQTNAATYPSVSSPLSAEVTSKLDTKNAKVGEVVTARTISETVFGNGAAVPKGAILSGKVTAVQSKSAGGGTASVTIAFDQVLPSKKAAPIAIHGILVGVAPKPYLSNSGPSAGSLPQASTRSQLMTSGETGQSVDNTAAVGESVALGSSLRDVTLASPPDNAAGTLTSSRGDIKLDHGTRIAVALQAN